MRTVKARHLLNQVLFEVLRHSSWGKPSQRTYTSGWPRAETDQVKTQPWQPSYARPAPVAAKALQALYAQVHHQRLQMLLGIARVRTSYKRYRAFLFETFALKIILFEVYMQTNRLLPCFLQYFEHFNPLRGFRKFEADEPKNQVDGKANYMLILLVRCVLIVTLFYHTRTTRESTKHLKVVGKKLPSIPPSTYRQHLFTMFPKGREVTYSRGYHDSLRLPSVDSHIGYGKSFRRRSSRYSFTVFRYVKALPNWGIAKITKGYAFRALGYPYFAKSAMGKNYE